MSARSLASSSLDSASKAEIPCHAPATREALGTVAVDGPEVVAATVARARTAQSAWAETSFAERRRVLRALLAYTVEHKDEICAWVCTDTGKTHENALVGEIWPVCEKFRWTIKNGPKHLRPEKVSSGLLVQKRAWLEYRPLGVVAAIIPWNYPFQNIVNPIIPALMAGNAVVIKPSEWVAWSSAKIVAAFRGVLESLGHNPDVINAVQGYGETGAALARAEVDTIIFIGSVANGRRVAQAAAERVVPVVLELGGKDPLIVCDDANLDRAVHASIAGTFINCGQNCVASERILVNAAVYDAFENRVAEIVRGFRQGDSQRGAVDVGAMITPLQLEVVERAVQRATEQGARVVAGGKRVFANQGDYFEPTILADVTPDMDIMKEEVFGPVMLLCRVNDDAHAIEVANSVDYALGSSVFSKDTTRARRIADQVRAGMVGINDFGGMTYMAQDLTFGGVKASGFGRMNGKAGLRSMTNVKAVLDDRFPFNPPNKVLPAGEKDYSTFSGVIDLVYGRSLGDRVQGLLRILGKKVAP